MFLKPKKNNFYLIKIFHFQDAFLRNRVFLFIILFNISLAIWFLQMLKWRIWVIIIFILYFFSKSKQKTLTNKKKQEKENHY